MEAKTYSWRRATTADIAKVEAWRGMPLGWVIVEPSGRLADWPMLDTEAEAKADTAEFNDDLSDVELADIARAVFLQGLRDGATLSAPHTAEHLMFWLPPYDHRIGHKKKLRQVYGAGFDIAAMMRRVRSKALK